jgi:Spy/CpxP family protein refolding chaperone
MPEELRVAAEQMRANTQRAAGQIRSVLTPEQAEKLRGLRGPATRPGTR